jgi:hypothetical protein
MREEATLRIPVTVDKSHIIALGERLYGESIELVRELVNNAYDADASGVNVQINKDNIVVEDDGNGMTLEGLKEYFNIGSPQKRILKKSPRFAREMIGQFGIGKFSSLSACQRFEVWTKKDNFAATVTFDKHEWEKNKDAWHLPLKIHTPSPKQKNGTRVTLTGLTKNFKVSDVNAHLMETVPLKAPNFSVYVNGEKLSSQYIAGKKIPFLEGTEFGTVYGEIILVTSGSSPQEKAGIQCKVKGVTIKRDFFGLENLGSPAKKIYGFVNANFLPITSDRTGFIIDSPQYQAFEAVMQQVAKRVREQLRILADERGNRKINRRLKETMKRIEKALLHNPDLCPFGLAAQGEKLEQGEEKLEITKEEKEEKGGPPPEKWKEPKGRNKEKPKFEQFPRKRPKIRSLTSTGVIRQLKAKEMGITCLVDHFGEDGPESYIEGSVVYINRDHPVYKEAAKTRLSFVMHLARLLTQEIALLSHPDNPHLAYQRQSKLMRDAFEKEESISF